jgi:hypothetical protein
MFKPSIADKIAAVKSQITGIPNIQQVPMTLENSPGDTTIQQPKLTNVNQTSSQAANQIDTPQSALAADKIPNTDTSASYNVVYTSEFTGEPANTQVKSTGFMASLQGAINGAINDAINDIYSPPPSDNITVNSKPLADPEIHSAPPPRPVSRPDIPTFNPSVIGNRPDPAIPVQGSQPAYTPPMMNNRTYQSTQTPKFKAYPKPR